MQISISAKTEKNLARAVNRVTHPVNSRSYELCIKADALRFAKSYRESVRVYLDSIMTDRCNQDAYWGLADSYKYLKEYDKEARTLERLIELDDKQDKYYFELGLCKFSNGYPEEAIPHFIKAITLNKDNLEAQIQLALAHAASDEPEMALMIYNKIIETNPEFLKAHYFKASMLLQEGNYKEAAGIFFNIIKRNPEYYKAHLGIAMCFDKMQRISDAVRYYKKFLNLKKFSEDAIFARRRIEEIKEVKSRKNNPLSVV